MRAGLAVSLIASAVTGGLLLREAIDATDPTELQVYNFTPYNVEVTVVHHDATGPVSVVERLSPGSRLVTTGTISETATSFHVAARSVDTDGLFSWAYPSPAGQGAVMEWTIEQPTGRSGSPLSRRRSGSHVLYDERFAHTYATAAAAESFEEFLQQARLATWELVAAARRQIAYFEAGRSVERPQYDLGARTVDENGYFNRGVVLAWVPSETVFKAPCPFVAGDVLLTFNGQAVFGEADLLQMLHGHASYHGAGIRKPFTFEILRGDQVLAGATTFFFGEEFYGYNSADRSGAAGYGFCDSFAVGFCAEAVPAVRNVLALAWNFVAGAVETVSGEKGTVQRAGYVDRAQVSWEMEQKLARLAQMYPQEFEGGSLFGMLMPVAPVRLAVVKGLGQAGRATRLGRISRSVLAESVELAIWTAKTAPPGARPEEILKDFARGLPISLTIGASAGLLSRGAVN